MVKHLKRLAITNLLIVLIALVPLFQGHSWGERIQGNNTLSTDATDTEIFWESDATDESEWELAEGFAAIDDCNDGDIVMWDDDTLSYKCTKDPIPKSYQKGFNDALECMMLLDLELELKGEKMTWGDMADLFRQRFLEQEGN